MYEVVLQLSDDVAAKLQQGCECTGDAQALLDTAQDCNVTLIAQEPVAQESGGEVAELDSYFSILVSDGDSAERVRERFSTLKGVKGAYLKPPGEPP